MKTILLETPNQQVGIVRVDLEEKLETSTKFLHTQKLLEIHTIWI